MAMRTHACGEVSEKDIGSRVALAGWTNKWRDHGGVVFIDLRDRSGIVQVVFSPEVDHDIHRAAHRIRNEFVIRIEGDVRERPEGTVNPSIPTGRVEVVAKKLEVLNESRALPFMIDDEADASESLRYRHRYLDLRRPVIQRNIMIRHRAARAFREYLNARGFLEIETPVLTKSTPEGGAGLSRAEQDKPGPLLCPAPVAPDIQADPHGVGS